MVLHFAHLAISQPWKPHASEMCMKIPELHGVLNSALHTYKIPCLWRYYWPFLWQFHSYYVKIPPWKPSQVFLLSPFQLFGLSFHWLPYIYIGVCMRVCVFPWLPVVHCLISQNPRVFHYITLLTSKKWLIISLKPKTDLEYWLHWFVFVSFWVNFLNLSVSFSSMLFGENSKNLPYIWCED